MESTHAQLAASAAAVSRGRLWTGRIIAGLVVLFCLFDAATKLLKPGPVLEAFARTGWPT